jgi:probable phosphoglycerate mutase
LRDRLERERLAVDVLLASTLPRARQTAEVLGEALGLQPVCHAELCEHVPGEIDGNLWETWERFDPVAEPDRPLSGGGESTNQFRARVSGLLDRLSATHDGGTVVAATHGGVVWASLWAVVGPDNPGQTQGAEFTSITEFVHQDGEWRLVRFNDVEHLAGTDLLGVS